MKKTDIDWCDSTLNAVVGCPRNCEYCYAKKMNDRFGWVKDWTKPQFFPERLKQLKSKKPKSIFMDSMSDIAFWTHEANVFVNDTIKANMQHRYIFLTKGILKENEGIYGFVGKLENCYFGLTVEKQVDLQKIRWGQCFLSIEPILEPIKIDISKLKDIEQVIIGAETGNRKGKVIPKKEWVTDIVKDCDKYKIRVFMKESLRKLMGADFRQDPLIWEIERGTL